jgi:hypothetical protein
MVLAPPAPSALPESLWPSDGGSGDDGGGHDGGEGGGGWWGEEPDEWEAGSSAPYQHSRARRVLSLFTVLVLGLASVGGVLLLLVGSSSGAALSSHVLSVEMVAADPGSGSARVTFSVTNTAGSASGARCVVTVFGGGAALGSTTVASLTPIDVGTTDRGAALVSLGRPAHPSSASVACRQDGVVTAK